MFRICVIVALLMGALPAVSQTFNPHEACAISQVRAYEMQRQIADASKKFDATSGLTLRGKDESDAVNKRWSKIKVQMIDLIREHDAYCREIKP